MEVSPGFVKIQWVRPRHAAKLLGCGLTKTYELIADGRLVTKKVDGMRLISVVSIERIGEQSEEPQQAS
jgi:excisionase family DNA binding protein